MNDKKRIELLEGKQKELIEKVKRKTNYTWRKLSTELGVCEGYLKNELRNEVRTLREDVYFKLTKLAGKSNDGAIEDILGSNWGSIKGGNNSIFKTTQPRLLISEQDEDLAECIGILLGDGNCYFNGKIGMIRITGHKFDDRAYLLDYVKPLFENLFNMRMSIQIPNDGRNALKLYKAGKSLIYTLRHFGIIPGNKRKNNVGIPQWIFEKEEYIRACLRGLIDTDGSIYPKTKNHKTPTIWFNSAIPQLRNDFKKSLAILNYKVSKWTKKHSKNMYGKGVCQCSIGSRESVLRYYKEIGFGNPKHEKRFRRFWKAPIV